MLPVRRLFIAALLSLAAAPLSAPAQETPAPERPRIVFVDKDRVLRESAVAERLTRLERAARASLQSEFAEFSKEIDAEEAELAALREQIAKDEFDDRVRAFNDKVQQARRTIQQRSEATQKQFQQARQQVAEALPPVLIDLMTREGAEMIVDVRMVLAARRDADRTAEAIRLFDAATADLFPAEE